MLAASSASAGNPVTMRRLATPHDLEAVFTIYMHERVVPFLGYDPMPLEEFRAIYKELVDSRCFYIYEDGGRVAGSTGRAAIPAACGTWPASARWRSIRRCTARALPTRW
jgi:hypothetical protein